MKQMSKKHHGLITTTRYPPISYLLKIGYSKYSNRVATGFLFEVQAEKGKAVGSCYPKPINRSSNVTGKGEGG